MSDSGSAPEPRPERAAVKRLRGLDAIRFCAALTVVLGHQGGPPLFGADATGVRWLVVRGLRCAFNGPAAVIVFFVLSGLVIHHPTATGAESPGLPYFLRRYVRILGPVFAALAWAAFVGEHASLLLRGVLWSLWAELIYYTLYPWLLPLGRRHGWTKLIAAAYVPAFLISIFHGNENFVVGDTLTDWIVGLPCWLTGCWLAEHLVDRIVGFAAIWTWRAGIWAASALLLVFRFHTALTYRYTLPLFSIPVALWLLREIAYYQDGAGAGVTRRPWAWLERAGGWSYSLYIAHSIAFVWLEKHPRLLSVVGTNPVATWTWDIALILGLSYVFSRLFERPSQRLARWCANAARARRRTIHSGG